MYGSSRSTFPMRTKQAVFSRMKANASSRRASIGPTGAEQAAKIRADADRQRDVILAKAYAASENPRAKGSAGDQVYTPMATVGSRVLQFLRTLEAYTKFIVDKTNCPAARFALLKYLGAPSPATVPSATTK